LVIQLFLFVISIYGLHQIRNNTYSETVYSFLPVKSHSEATSTMLTFSELWANLLVSNPARIESERKEKQHRAVEEERYSEYDAILMVDKYEPRQSSIKLSTVFSSPNPPTRKVGLTFVCPTYGCETGLDHKKKDIPSSVGCAKIMRYP